MSNTICMCEGAVHRLNIKGDTRKKEEKETKWVKIITHTRSAVLLSSLPHFSTFMSFSSRFFCHSVLVILTLHP